MPEVSSFTTIACMPTTIKRPETFAQVARLPTAPRNLNIVKKNCSAEIRVWNTVQATSGIRSADSNEQFVSNSTFASGGCTR